MKIRFLFLVVLLTIPNIVLADGPSNFAKYWKSLTVKERISYLDGYKEGVIHGFWKMAAIIDLRKEKAKSQQARQVLKEIYIDIDMTVLNNVISDLYDDPANTYIELVDMIYIARDKTQGNPIEDMLLRARRKAQEAYKIIQELKKEERKLK